MNVIALHMADNDTPNACEIYRANMPLTVMAENSQHTGVWKRKSELREAYQSGHNRVFLELASSYDIVVLPRLTSGQGMALKGIAALLKLIRLAGGRSVYEVDDDFTNKHRDLTSYGVSDAMRIASWCDAVTVTTPYLAEVMRQETRRPIYVLPNMISPQIWKRPENRIDKDFLTIGLSGSLTHEADWRVLETVLPRIFANDYGREVRLRLTGYHPDYLRELPNTDYLPVMDYVTYAEVIRSCDLILAPVVPDDAFNLCKSPIKVVEGMGATRMVDGALAGAACIATDNPVYRLAIQSGTNGLLVEHTPEGWYTALDDLLRNEAKRHQIQRAGHAWVWNHHDISRTWVQWVQAYQKIASRPSNTLALPYAS